MSRRFPKIPIASLVDQFAEYARPISDDPKTPAHTIRIGAYKLEAEICFPAKAPDGFEVRITVDNLGVLVHSGQLVHAHIDHVSDPEGVMQAAFGMVRDLLSPDMRLRERYAGKQIIFAAVEQFDGVAWRRSHSTGLLLFNYFRKRRELIFVNHQLPGRLSTGLNKKA